MAYNTKNILLDAGNKPIPQYWDADADSYQPMSNQVKVVPTTLKAANVATVTTAGTRVQLPSQACSCVTVVAKRTNTGYIYVGMSTVSSTVYGVELAANGSMDFYVSNLNELWIDSSVNGEGISYVAV